MGMDQHPFTGYFEVHQGTRVWIHAHIIHNWWNAYCWWNHCSWLCQILGETICWKNMLMKLYNRHQQCHGFCLTAQPCFMPNLGAWARSFRGSWRLARINQSGPDFRLWECWLGPVFKSLFKCRLVGWYSMKYIEILVLWLIGDHWWMGFLIKFWLVEKGLLKFHAPWTMIIPMHKGLFNLGHISSTNGVFEHCSVGGLLPGPPQAQGS